MPVSDISTYKRDTQGVRVMRVGENSKVISIALMFSFDADTAGSEEE